MSASDVQFNALRQKQLLGQFRADMK